MTKKVRLSGAATLASVLGKHRGWTEGLSSAAREQFEREVRDLLENGQAMGAQGATFRSTRTLSLDGQDVRVEARFGPRNLVGRLRDLVGL